MNFPEDIKPIIPHRTWNRRLTRISTNVFSGFTVSATARRFPLYSAELVYPRRMWGDYAALEAFLDSMQGMAGRFIFTDFNGWNSVVIGKEWTGLYVGVTDGTASTHTLPMKSTTTPHLFVDGVEKTIVTDYTFSDNSDPDDWETSLQDSITFVGAQTAGKLITLTATGRRSHRCRLLTDDDGWDNSVGLTTSLVSIGVIEAPERA